LLIGSAPYMRCSIITHLTIFYAQSTSIFKFSNLEFPLNLANGPLVISHLKRGIICTSK